MSSLKSCSSSNAVQFGIISTFRRNVSLQRYTSLLLLADFLLGLLFDPKDGEQYVPLKRRTFSELHGVTDQKDVLFIVTAGTTSNSTCQLWSAELCNGLNKSL
jgi:hypothetical protein